MIDYSNKKDVIKAIETFDINFNLDNMLKEFWEDRDVVLAAVKRSGYLLKFAPKFHEDKEVVMSAIPTYPHVLEYLPKFQDDKDVALAAVKLSQYTYKYHISERLKDNIEIFFTAYLKDKSAKEFASKRLNKCYVFSLWGDNVENEIRQILSLCKRPYEFALLPLERFEKKNSEFLKIVIDAIRQRLAELPKTEGNLKYTKEILGLIKETIKNRIKEFQNNSAYLEETNDGLEL